MFVMMNVGGITGDSAESGAIIQKFFTDNASRISGMTQFFPPAEWAATGLLEGDWGKLALFAAVSAAAAAVLILVLGIFYRKLSLLQSEAPQASGKKGIRKGSIRVGSAFMANVKREVLTILRVPAYAVNILPITFMPLVIIIMMGMMFNKSAGENGAQSLTQMMGNLNPALIMCIMALAVAYMAGMNPALSTAVTREGKGHDFIKSLPVSAKTLIHAKLAVGCGLETFGVIAAMIAMAVLIPGFTLETVLALILCLLFCFGTACLALSRDVKKPRLDWVTEQEAVKQNFGVLISMLVSWGILVALAGLAFVMIHFLNWGLIPVFAVLAVLLAAAAIGAYKLLMKNVKKYYFAG
jgi:ABC-2 type transport system permease protein